MEFEFDIECYEDFDLQEITVDEAIESFKTMYGLKPTRAIFSSSGTVIHKAGIKTHQLQESWPPMLYLGPIIDKQEVMLDVLDFVSTFDYTVVLCSDFSGAFIDENNEIALEWDNIEELVELVSWV